MSHKSHITVWLVKSAELEEVKRCCEERLAGLCFDVIYTLPYAMCLNTASEIMTNLEIENDQTIVATTKFSSVGLISPEKMRELRVTVQNHAKLAGTPVTLDTWREAVPDYVAMATDKATASIVSTLRELMLQKPFDRLTLLIINNDRLPLLELLALPLKQGLKVPADGDVVQMRFEVKSDGSAFDAKLVYVQCESRE